MVLRGEKFGEDPRGRKGFKYKRSNKSSLLQLSRRKEEGGGSHGPRLLSLCRLLTGIVVTRSSQGEKGLRL